MWTTTRAYIFFNASAMFFLRTKFGGALYIRGGAYVVRDCIFEQTSAKVRDTPIGPMSH